MVLKALKDSVVSRYKMMFSAKYEPIPWHYDFEVTVSGQYRPANGDKEFETYNFFTVVGNRALTKELIPVLKEEPVSFYKDNYIALDVRRQAKTGGKNVYANIYKIDKHELLGAGMGKCLGENTNPEGTKDASMLVQTEGCMGILVIKVRATELKIAKKKKMDLFIDVCVFFGDVSASLARSNCLYGVKTSGKSTETAWNQCLIHRTKEICIQLRRWEADYKDPVYLMFGNVKGGYLLEDPGKVHTISIESKPYKAAKQKKDVCKFELTYFYKPNFQSLLEYRRSGFSIHADFHADKKADADIVKTVTEKTNAVLKHWKDNESTNLNAFKATGETFSELLNNCMERARKIKPGKGYLIFVYFAGSSDHKDMTLETMHESSLLPMSVCIIRSDKMMAKWLHLDKIWEAMHQEETDFLEKKNKKRNNLYIVKYDKDVEIHGNEWRKEERIRAPLLKVGQHIVEYLYVNDIAPCPHMPEPPLKVIVTETAGPPK